MALPRFLVPGALTLARLAQQTLHDQHVLPLAVEAAVAAVNADLVPPTGLHQGNAWFIRGEDLPDQLVVAAALCLLGEPGQQRGPDPAAARRGVYVERRLSDPGVVLVRVVVGAHARPADH